MTLLGIDPGLRHSGLCLLHGSDISTHHISIETAQSWRRMAELVVAWVSSYPAQIDAIGLEDFVFRAPKVSHGLVKHASEIGKLVGFLVCALEDTAPVVLVPPSEAQRNTLKGKAAKAAGIPGVNDHERSAFYIASWLKGSMRMAGRR